MHLLQTSPFDSLPSHSLFLSRSPTLIVRKKKNQIFIIQEKKKNVKDQILRTVIVNIPQNMNPYIYIYIYYKN